MYKGIFEEEFSKSNRYRVYLPPNKASLCWSLQTFQSSSLTSSADFLSPSIDVAASFNPAIDDLILALKAPVMLANFLISDSITFCAGEEAVAFDSGLLWKMLLIHRWAISRICLQLGRKVKHRNNSSDFQIYHPIILKYQERLSALMAVLNV